MSCYEDLAGRLEPGLLTGCMQTVAGEPPKRNAEVLAHTTHGVSTRL